VTRRRAAGWGQVGDRGPGLMPVPDPVMAALRESKELPEGEEAAMWRTVGRLAVVLVFAASRAATAGAQAMPPPEPDVIVASGEAEIKMAPDRAFVTIVAEARSKSPRDAQRQNANTMTAVQKALQQEDIPAAAIRTLSYEVHPEYDYRDGRQTLRGYLARNSIEVRVDALERVGEIIDVAVQAGATSVGDVRFDLKDRTAVERDALARAVENARARAEALATAAGRAIERILRIEEQGASYVPPPPRPYARVGMAAEAAPPTPITPGDIDVRARVTLVAKLK
jgi:uncharacterized protein